MRKLLLVVLALLLVLPAASALAQGRGGGGRGGGGGQGGGGGRGGGGWHGGGGWRGGGGWHGGGWRGGVAYAYPYYPYWGWGWGWSPYYYGAFYYGRGYGAGYGGGPSDWAVVDTDVSPEEARLYLDGRYIGIADDFDGYPDFLYLRPGQYKLEFRLEGYESQTVNVDARPGVKLDLNSKLAKIPGARQHGSYHTPEPQGGVQRYWGKHRGVDVPYDGEGPPPRGGRDRNDVEARPDRDQAPPPPPAERPRDEGRSPPDVRPEGWRQGPPEAARQRQARLLLSVQPGDAAVYLDDRFLGIAQEIESVERGVPLAPGKHTVMVSRPGFKDQRVEIEVSAGESKKIDVSLVSLDK
jgi:hypothetical protein